MIQYAAVFDSGLGGLAVFRSLRKAYPKQNFIFFADNAQIPLGDKSQEQICHIAARGTRFLTKQHGDCQAMVVACGTASSYALSAINNETTLPVVDVIRPVVQMIFTENSPRTIAILATQASIAAGAYEREIKKYDNSCKIFPKAAPALVPLIEGGDFASLKIQLTQYLADFPKDLDVLILGCTHYIIIEELVKKLLPQTKIISPAKAIVDIFSPLAHMGSGLETFFCSKKTPLWERQAAQVLGYNVLWTEFTPDDIK